MGVQVDTIWTLFSRLHGPLRFTVLYKGHVFCCWTGTFKSSHRQPGCVTKDKGISLSGPQMLVC